MNAFLMALAVASSAQDAGLNTKIERFTSVAESVEAAVKRLADLSKEVLIVTGPIAAEPAYVELNNTTVQGVMDRLALATYGSWKEENGAYTLIQGADAATASAAQRQKRVALIKKALSDRVAELKKNQWGVNSAQAAVAEIDKMRDRYKNSFRVPEGERPRVNISGVPVQGPIDEVVAACLAGLSAEQLVDLASGQRVVLSSRPNRMQRPLSANLNGAISTYVRANAEIYDAAKSATLRDFNADWDGSLGIPRERNISVAKVNAVVARDQDSIVVEVQIIGGNGEDLGSKTVGLPLSALDSAGGEGFGEPSAADEGKIELSDLSREFLNMSGNFGQRNSMSMVMRSESGLVRVDAGQAPSAIRPSAGLAPFLNDPGTNDFLGLILPEALSSVREEKDFVAVVPDSLWAGLNDRFNGETIPVFEFERLLRASTEMVEVDDVRVWRPNDPIVCQKERLSRRAMQKLTDQVHRAGFGHVKDVAEYVMTRGREVNRGESDALLFSVSLPFVNPMLGDFPPMSPALAQFLYYGPNFVTEVPAGNNQWSYGQMNQRMKSAMESMVYSKKVFLSQGMSINVSVGDDEPRVPLASDREPTEKFPNGLTPDTVVTVDITDQIGVLGRLKGHPTGKLMSASQLGAITGFIEGSGGANSEMKITEFEEFLMANTRNISISMPGSVVQGHYTDGSLQPGARPLTYSQLNPDVISLGQAARDMVRQAAQNMQQQNQTVPPLN